MIGPHYQKLAEIEHRITAKQMLEKIKQRPDNPLSRVIDKLKKQFTQYETAYTDPIMDYQISSIDRVLSYDSKLGPILDALEKQNLLLRKQLGVLEGQLSNTVGICQQILAENNELKLIVKRKNEDIGKIIQTIAGNQAQEMDQLEEKNSLLMRENSILMTHLEQIKKQHEKYAEAFRDHEEELNQMQRKTNEAKKQLTQSVARERQLSRKISLLEQSVYQHNDELYHLRQVKQTLTFENNELKNQIVVFQGKSEGTNSESIKKQMENEYAPIVEEHKMLKKERAQLLREAQKLKLQKEKLEDIMLKMQREGNKANGDLELTASLLTEQKTKNASLISSISKLEARVSDLKQECNRLRAEKETNDNYAVTRQKRLLQQIDELRKHLDDKQKDVENRIRQISRSMQSLLESKDVELKGLREENLHLQRMLEQR